MVFAMKQFGTVLSMRVSGKQAFNEIEPFLRMGKRVTFDFEGVDSVTNSFADELFGHLISEFGMARLKELTTFAHINQIAAITVRNAMDHRAIASAVS